MVITSNQVAKSSSVANTQSPLCHCYIEVCYVYCNKDSTVTCVLSSVYAKEENGGGPTQLDVERDTCLGSFLACCFHISFFAYFKAMGDQGKHCPIHLITISSRQYALGSIYSILQDVPIMVSPHYRLPKQVRHPTCLFCFHAQPH